MIAADREQIVARLKRDEVQLYLEMLNFYTNSFQALGTTVAVVSAFGFSILANNLPESSPFLPFALFQVTTVLSMFAAVWCVYTCCLVYIAGPGLALRGPQGSMKAAVESMREEISTCMKYLLCSIVALHAATVFLSFSYLDYIDNTSDPGNASDFAPPICVTILAVISLYILFRKEWLVKQKFLFKELKMKNVGGILESIHGEGIFNPEPGTYKTGPSQAHICLESLPVDEVDEDRSVSEMERLLPVLQRLEQQNQQLIDSQQRQSQVFEGMLGMAIKKETLNGEQRESYMDSFSSSVFVEDKMER